MSLEQAMTDLTAALIANTAALKGAKGGTTTAAAGKTTATDAKASKVTFEMVKAAVVEVKDLKGKPVAQAIIKGAGKAVDLASIKPAQYDAVMTACAEAKAEEEPEVPTDDDTL